MTLGGAWIVMRKEVVDNLRDRRTLAAALFYPLLGPVLLVLLLTVIGRSFSDRAESALELPLIGAEHAPNLVRFLTQQGAEILPAPPDPEAAVKAGDVDLVLVIPASFTEQFRAGEPASLQLISDESRQSATISIRRARQLLDAYSGQVSALRLLARGISPVVVQPLSIEDLSVATPQSQAAGFMNMTGYFLIYSIFIGGMYLAIDTTAGERERKSLEPLLLSPLPRRELVLGKLGATLVFTLVAVVETLLAFGIVLNRIPLEDYLGIRFGLSGAAILRVFLIVLPILPLASALQIIIASFTRSFKEAQNYLSMLPLVPALPGLFLAFLPVKPSLWAMLIPTFGQQLLINQVMRDEPIASAHLVVSAGTTLVAAVLLIGLAVRLYERETLVFGR
ncbi:MAG: ABC transporter permease [Caldilineae bacterium]|nr:ABC transporter permease [Caldilineae bacterium]